LTSIYCYVKKITFYLLENSKKFTPLEILAGFRRAEVVPTTQAGHYF